MTPDDYWAALTALGVSRMRRLTPESWLCRDRDGELYSVDDPTPFTPNQRLELFALLRRRIVPFES